MTRVYVGAHFPSDVLAGAALGTAVGMGTVRAFGTRYPKV